MSTSIDPNVAIDFSSDKYMTIMKIAKGSHVVHLAQVTNPIFAGEQEILLPFMMDFYFLSKLHDRRFWRNTLTHQGFTFPPKSTILGTIELMYIDFPKINIELMKVPGIEFDYSTNKLLSYTSNSII